MSAKSEYRRIRKNLLNQIRRLLKEGYQVDLEVPKIPKKITAGSVRRLQKVAKSLREHTTYKGFRGLSAHRKMREERAAQRPPKPPKKKKQKEEQKEEDIQDLGPVPPEEESEERSDTGEYGEDDWLPGEGEIVYQHIQEMLDSAYAYADEKNRPDISYRASYVEGEINRAITDSSSWNEFLENLAETDPDLITEAQWVVRYKDKYEEDRQQRRLYQMMKFGEMFTEAEARDMEPPSYPDEGETWSESSWENLFDYGDEYE